MVGGIGRNRYLKIGRQGRAVGYFDWFGAGFSLTIKQGLRMATFLRSMSGWVAGVFCLTSRHCAGVFVRAFVCKKNKEKQCAAYQFYPSSYSLLCRTLLILTARRSVCFGVRRLR